MIRRLYDRLVCPCLPGAPEHQHNRGGYATTLTEYLTRRIHAEP